MKTITIRDLRQRWPEAEAALKVEEEILITRDAKPVAKLVRVSTAATKRPRWNMEEHAHWQRKVVGGRVSRSDAALAAGRAGAKDKVGRSPGGHERRLAAQIQRFSEQAITGEDIV